MFKRVLLAGLLLLAWASVCSAQRYRPETYGVVVGAGQPASVKAANYEAMKSCIQAAMAAKASVSLPAATIEIDIPNKGSLETSAFRITSDLRITGAGRDESKLKFGPESPTYRYAGFYVGPNTNVSFKNCTIEGPTDPGPNGKFNARTCAIRQVGSSQNSSGTVHDNPGRIQLKKVIIAREFFVGILGDHGDVSLKITKCDISAYSQCIGWFAAFNTGKSLQATKTYFHDAGLGGDIDETDNGHLLYLSPNVSLDINDCRFGGNYRYAIHHYGSSQLPPRYARLNNCTFEETCADGIETTNTGLTEITNCTFNNSGRGISLKGDTAVQDSTFNCPTGVTTYDNHSNVQVSITRCKFNTAATAVVTSVWPNCVWKISDCEFLGQSPRSIGTAQGAPGCQVYIDKCRFSGTWKRGVRIAGGSFFVIGCNFGGSYADAAVMYDDASGSVGKVAVDNSTFENTGRSIWAAAGGSGKITGGGNYFGGNQPGAMVGIYQNLQLRKAFSPEKLVSADTVEPSFNYDSYRVIGTARINNIKVGGTDEVNRMCEGKMVLFADGGWSIGDTGNIRPLLTGARRVGEAVTLVHDPQAGYWLEVRE